MTAMEANDTKQTQDNAQQAEGDSVQKVVSVVEIPATRKLIAGWRNFECSSCTHTWSTKTRDHKSPSGENCSKCDEWEFPISSNSDRNLKTDVSGNLS